VRQHLCVVLAGPAGQVEQWRRTWDPVMALVVPTHVTVAYPEEIVDEDLLLHRAELCIGAVQPIRLRLGEVFAECHAALVPGAS
jgi:hypothetical protein